MKLIVKSQDYNLLGYFSNGGAFTFPTNKLVNNSKRLSGNKRDMRKKLFKSPYPTYSNNRIVNKAEEGLKFAEFKPVDTRGLQGSYTTPEIVEMFEANKAKKPNKEFEYLSKFNSIEDLIKMRQENNKELLGPIEGVDESLTTSAPKKFLNFDVDKTISYLVSHAHNATTGQCAKYVREALEAGGIDTSGYPRAAADYVGHMSKMGFNLLINGYGNKLPDNYTPQKGDVAVIGRVGKHRYGHIAIYTGTQWVSDFKQKGFQIYDNIKDYTIWRHKQYESKEV